MRDVLQALLGLFLILLLGCGGHCPQCGGCGKKPHAQVRGICISCRSETESGTDAICKDCASRKNRCLHCGADLR